MPEPDCVVSEVLEAEVGDDPPERVAAELLVAFLASDERPPRGAPGRVDWRLCGLLSERLVAGVAGAARGEAMLIPAPGRLAAGRALMVGVGPLAELDARGFAAAAEAAMARALALGVRDLALALPTERTGRPSAAEAACAVVQAAASLLGGRGHGLRLRIVAPPGTASGAATALGQLGPELGGVELRPLGRGRHAAPAARPASRPARPAGPAG